MAVGLARLLTILAVAGPCAFAMSGGWHIVRFAAAKADAPERRADAVRPWTAVPGLAGEALQTTLMPIASAADGETVRKRADALAAILAVHPLSSDTWLSLAGVRLVSGQAYDKILGALQMSSLMGPNEGNVMVHRGIFGIVLWDALPSNIRTRVIADLAEPIRAAIVSDAEADAARKVLIAASASKRKEIAELLVVEGISVKNLARIGL